MAATWIAASAALGSAIFGAVGQSQQNAQSQKAVDQKYKYDKQSYNMNNKKIKADYDFLVDKILSEERNFDTQRAYKDAIAQDTYNRELQIAAIERAVNQMAFQKSEAVYQRQLSINENERRYAREAAYQQRKEIQQAAAFDNSQTIIDSLKAQGAALARGQAGRSSAQVQQAELASFGRDQAVLAASLLSADRNLQSTLRDINLSYATANLQAEANRMLPPPPVLDPIKPRPTPDMEFILPRKLKKFDFGPEPIKGVAMTTSPWLTFANTALSSAASIATANID